MEFVVIECIPSEFPNAFRQWYKDFFGWNRGWKVEDVKHDGNVHYICVCKED